MIAPALSLLVLLAAPQDSVRAPADELRALRAEVRALREEVRALRDEMRGERGGDVARLRAELSRERRKNETLRDFLVAGFQSVDPRQSGPDLTVANLLSRAGHQLQELNRPDDVQAQIAESMAAVQLQLGDQAAARVHLLEALELQSKRLGTEHPLTRKLQQKLHGLDQSKAQPPTPKRKKRRLRL